jgi:hypothetical protein
MKNEKRERTAQYPRSQYSITMIQMHDAGKRGMK